MNHRPFSRHFTGVMCCNKKKIEKKYYERMKNNFLVFPLRLHIISGQTTILGRVYEMSIIGY